MYQWYLENCNNKYDIKEIESFDDIIKKVVLIMFLLNY